MESPTEGPKVGDLVPDSYIVFLKDDVSPSTFKSHQDWVCGCHATSLRSRGLPPAEEPLEHVYDFGTLKGYCGTFDQATIDEIAARPDVAYVEPNRLYGPVVEGIEYPPLETASNVEDSDAGAALDYDEVLLKAEFNYVKPDDTAAAAVAAEGEGEAEGISLYAESLSSVMNFNSSSRGTIIQNPIHSWGLAAISHRSGHGNRYIHHDSAGFGVVVFVLDTGIRISHTDFRGRAKWGQNFIRGSGNNDIHGHGTHVAGTVAGHYLGVAKRATVVAVKVLSDQGPGPLAGIIAGIQWAVHHAPPGGRSVINMSLGGPFSRAQNDAVEHAVRAGVTVIVAAGNEGTNANTRSPASAPFAITVGSIDHTHQRASNSNFGPAVNIFAPGVGIVSAGSRHDNDSFRASGTSMAAPHVAGVAAFLIVLENLRGPQAVMNRLVHHAGRNMVRDARPGSANLFLHNGSNMG